MPVTNGRLHWLPGLAGLLAAAGLVAPAGASAAPARHRGPPPATAPVRFARTAIQLDAFRGLSVRTCLEAARTGRPVREPVLLQSAAGRGGPWRQLAAIAPGSGAAGYCVAGAAAWAAAVPAPAPAAWYRLSFPGTRRLRAASSMPAYRARDVTRITGFRVTPRRLPRGAAVTVSGRLWRQSDGWHPDPGRYVMIVFRYRGEWYYFKPLSRTGPLGYFGGRFIAQVSGPWAARYGGASGVFGSISPFVPVTITASDTSGA
jgi:hypothetical protein